MDGTRPWTFFFSQGPKMLIFVKRIFLNYNQIQILITSSLFMRSKNGCSETQIPVLVKLTHMQASTS